MEPKNMNGFCELTQEETMEIDGGAWKTIAKDIGFSILFDGAKKFAKEAWNNRANWGVKFKLKQQKKKAKHRGH